jgi:hypothetical protein
MDARRANDRIADKAEQLRFVSRVPMLCECSEPACRAIVMIDLGDYHAIRRAEDAVLTAPGHQVDGAELETHTPQYEVLRVGRRDNGDGDRRSA